MAKAAKRPATSEWGTPDPCNARAYPSVSGTLPTQWAWEFLRRRPDYRRRYEQLIGDRGRRKTCETQDDRTTTWRSPAEVLRQEFRIYPSSQNSSLDPCLDERPLFEGVEVITEVEVENDAPANLPTKVRLEFDVTLPVEPQLDTARLLLLQRAGEWSSTRRIKMQVDKFPRYLRLLDFEDAGASDKEIGEHLFPSVGGERLRNLIRDTLDAAQRWQRDYLLIAMHSSAPS